MAGSGLLALLDDITALLDDIATMTKVAATKTAGVTGDDLAVSADQLNGIAAAREIPVVKAVAIGSLKNKAILVPATMGISALSVLSGLPLIPILLVAGGTYLCYEGFEKILHAKDKQSDKRHVKMLEAAAHDTLEKFEREKIKDAIRTDMVLSGEIMILALGTVADKPMLMQLAVLTGVAIGMTVFVYGLVAMIVKLDDLGLWMTQKEGLSFFKKSVRCIGHGLVNAAPFLLKGLTIIGTAAMFMVGGEMLLHNIPVLAHLTHDLGGLAAIGASIGAGIACGGVAAAGMKLFSKFRFRKKPA